MTDLPPAAEPDEDEPKVDRRDRDLSRLKQVREQFLGGEDNAQGLVDDIEAGFVGQADRSNSIMDAWDAYKCVLGGGQYYNGNSKIFAPFLANAIRARTTRFLNQIFPASGRYVDATTANGDIPFRTLAMMEHYIRRANLKNQVVRPMLKNGDIEGNYTVYADWQSRNRKVLFRGERTVQENGQDRPEYGQVEDLLEEEVEDAGPNVEVINDSDFLVLPVTAPTIEDALLQGGAVCIRRRFTKRMIRLMIEEGDIEKRAGEDFIDAMGQTDESPPGRRDTAKKIGEAAGIRTNRGIKQATVCEVWTRIKVAKERVLVRAYWAGDDRLLSVKRNPYWNDRCPAVTKPLDRDATSIKGRPPISDAMDVQIAINDMVNEAIDVSHYAALPITAADPVENTRNDDLVVGLGAVWDINPNAVKFLEFPALYEKLLPFIDRLEQIILQTLGVNPSMLPQSTGKPGAKRNQAEVALEQQVDVLTTADACSVAEDVLNEVLVRFVEYDHQFRDKPMMIRAYGPFGRLANMENIGPQQLDAAYEITWLGVESARNAAMAQQQIAGLATLMKIPPQMLNGRKLDVGPALMQVALSLYGPRIAPLTLVDLRDQQSVPPEEEETMLGEGFQVMPMPLDDDRKHLQVHMQAYQQMGDPYGTRQLHIMGHQHQLQAKAMAAAQQQGGGRQPQGGGGGNAGASPSGPITTPRVPGAIHKDRMPAAGAVETPRKMGAGPAI